ncbi:MAG: hypothetical protein ABIY50_04865 [Ignavibacteria bacterium]
MKKINSVLYLLILPVLLIILSILYKASIGEYFIGGFYDPAYNYLINSLNLSQFNAYGVGNFDHPGTPVQVMGAFVIKFFHMISGNDPDIAKDVFTRPEFYLSRIFIVFVLMIASALFFLGLIVYKKLNDIKSAIFLQLTPFYFSTVYYQFTNFTSEPFLIFTILIFIGIVIYFVNDPDMSKSKSMKYAVIFGLICGFGLASKISIFPVFIIPLLLLRKISVKVIFLVVLILSFMAFIYPAFSSDNASKYSSWVKGVITHSGKYGEGSENFIDSEKFSTNIKTIFFTDPVFGFTYFMIFFFLIFQFFLKTGKIIRKNKYFILLVGIFLAMSGQVFIVAKHFEPHYMIPAMMLTVFGLFVLNSVAWSIFPAYFGRNKIAYISLVMMVFTYFQVINITKETTYFKNRRDESYKVMNYLKENYKDMPVVTTYGSSSREFSLYLGVYWGGTQKERYSKLLNNLYPNYYYFDRWRRDFDQVSDIERMKTQLLNSGKIILQTDSKEVLNNFMEKIKLIANKPNASFKSVISNFRGENIYEIDLNPS